MLRRLGIPALALAAALSAAVPGVTMARDRDDHREAFQGNAEVRDRDFDHDRDRDHDRDWDRDRGRWNLGFGVYGAPVPAPAPSPAGYYDQYGTWHPYASYGRGYYGY